jgi:hypothetical protein
MFACTFAPTSPDCFSVEEFCETIEEGKRVMQDRRAVVVVPSSPHHPKDVAFPRRRKEKEMTNNCQQTHPIRLWR